MEKGEMMPNNDCCPCFIAIHLGAGYHSKLKLSKYRSLSKKACMLGSKLCRDGHQASFIACQIMSALEDNDLTNAGYGSNLTKNGMVQCDASIMESKSGNFAAVGCIEGIKNPIKVAYELLMSQNSPSNGLQPPMVLAGKGARDWAFKKGIDCIDNSMLISKRALETHENALNVLRMNAAKCSQKYPLKYNSEYGSNSDDGEKEEEIRKTSCQEEVLDMPCNLSEHDSSDFGYNPNQGSSLKRKHSEINKKIDKTMKGLKGADPDLELNESLFSGEERLDTVGAIVVDKYGNVCSAVSSGGLILKEAGRIGQAATYGCGCYVADKETKQKQEICASSTSGCGEQLIKTFLAKHCVDTMLTSNDEVNTVHNDDQDNCEDDFDDDLGIMNQLRVLESGFLNSKALRGTGMKIAGCIVIKLTKNVKESSNIMHSDTTNSKDGAVATDPEEKSKTCQRDTHWSLDMIVSSTARTFCVAFISTKERKFKFLLLEMPDSKRVGETAVSQEFHFNF